MSITILRTAVDTLEASFEGRVRTDRLDMIAELKLQAQQFDTPQQLFIHGLEYAVQPQGAKPYPYRLTGQEATIRLTDSDKKIPAASVRLSSLGLALYEPLDLFDLVSDILYEEFGVYGAQHLSRIDVACDFQGFDPSGPHGAKFICPARFRPIYPSVEHPQTFHFGKGDIVVRVYNKTAEIKTSGKTWLYGAWEQHPGYDPLKDVWRFEIQSRRHALRQFDLLDPVSGIENMHGLLDYGLRWADLRIPEGISSDRWSRHPAWVALAEACGVHTTITRQQLDKDLAPMKHLVAAVGGYAISAGAVLDSGDFDSVWSIMGDRVKAQLGSSYADRVQQRRLERIGKGGR